MWWGEGSVCVCVVVGSQCFDMHMNLKMEVMWRHIIVCCSEWFDEQVLLTPQVPKCGCPDCSSDTQCNSAISKHLQVRK